MTVLDTLITAANDFAAVVPAQIPDPDPVQPPGTGGVTTFMSWVKWGGYAFVGGAILVGGAALAVAGFRRGEAHDALPKILWPCLAAIVIGAGASWIGILATGGV